MKRKISNFLKPGKSDPYDKVVPDKRLKHNRESGPFYNPAKKSLYVTNDKTGMIKVGVTRRDPKTRLKEHWVSNPRLKLVYSKEFRKEKAQAMETVEITVEKLVKFVKFIEKFSIRNIYDKFY